MNKLGFETGTICMFASNTIPTTETISGVKDWLLCDGGNYSTSTYSTLYAVVGTVFGTSGSNFKVPDFRTFFPVGVGTGFSLGTAITASAASGSAVLKAQPINFIIKT
jgi:microcystin-dependent protein